MRHGEALEAAGLYADAAAAYGAVLEAAQIHPRLLGPGAPAQPWQVYDYHGIALRRAVDFPAAAAAFDAGLASLEAEPPAQPVARGTWRVRLLQHKLNALQHAPGGEAAAAGARRALWGGAYERLEAGEARRGGRVACVYIPVGNDPEPACGGRRHGRAAGRAPLRAPGRARRAGGRARGAAPATGPVSRGRTGGGPGRGRARRRRWRRRPQRPGACERTLATSCERGAPAAAAKPRVRPLRRGGGLSVRRVRRRELLRRRVRDCRLAGAPASVRPRRGRGRGAAPAALKR